MISILERGLASLEMSREGTGEHLARMLGLQTQQLAPHVHTSMHCHVKCNVMYTPTPKGNATIQLCPE